MVRGAEREGSGLEELYQETQDALLRYCVSLAHDESAAEDLAQETFLRAWTHLDELEDLAPAQRRAWLRRTARNLWIDNLRKHSRETFPGDEALEMASFEEDFTRGEVWHLLNCLPPEEGPLFRMRYFEGWNAAELGEIFDLPPGTVRSRLSSARKRLRKLLNE